MADLEVTFTKNGQAAVKPQPAQIARFLACFDIMDKFAAQHQYMRGWGAFDPKEWPEMPDPSVVAVLDWLRKIGS